MSLPLSLSASSFSYSALELASAGAHTTPLVPGEEQAVLAWLEQQGFNKGELRREASIDGRRMMSPMARACQKGQENVCKWLHAHGAAEDTTKPNQYGHTPMLRACDNGHLSICKWLYEVGAVEDVAKAE